MPLSDLVEKIGQHLAPGGWTTDPEIIEGNLSEWRGRYRGETPLMIMPASTQETASAVRLCAEAGVAITPQGGNTGLVGAQIPNGEVLISLRRMNKIRTVSPEDDAMTVEAGVVLSAAQAAAREADRYFPLSLASEGSATIGGLISTNAGGVHVVRFGMMRDQVLGLEVVLPDGRILPALKALRKDNTGYDLKQLFIGAEGTLGIITAATLKLQPRAAEHVLVAASLPGPEAGMRLLHFMKGRTGALTAFELLNPFSVSLTKRAFPHLRDPLPEAKGWRALIEFASVRQAGLRAGVEDALAAAMAAHLLDDAVIAESEGQVREFWKLREEVSAAHRNVGAQTSMDISVPVARVLDFLGKAEAAVLRLAPDARILAFGHAGDGNIHYTVVQPEGAPNHAFRALCPAITETVQDLAVSLGGSISAEHGIGVTRRADLPRYKDAVTLDVMAKVKAALDPNRLMNPRALT
jgi:FAD/FMN-containing dehydrogenase